MTKDQVAWEVGAQVGAQCCAVRVEVRLSGCGHEGEGEVLRNSGVLSCGIRRPVFLQVASWNIAPFCHQAQIKGVPIAWSCKKHEMN